MPDSPITRPSLLLRLRDPEDAKAWGQFVHLYGPLIYRFGRRRGLQDADAADLTQTVFQAIAVQIRGWDYDPRRGSFRGWLFAVTRNQLHQLLVRQQRCSQGSGDTSVQGLLEQQPAREDEEALHWDQEYERRVLLWAAEQVRSSFEETSWQAFWQTAVEGKSAGEVAQGLGLTVGAVYTAKSRVLDRIKKEIRQLDGDLPEAEGEER